MKKQTLVWLLIALALFSSCRNLGSKIVKGNGIPKEASHSITAFKKIRVDGIATVHISQGELSPIRILGDENLLPYITITQKGEEIVIHNKIFYGLETKTNVDVYISGPVYQSIEVSGVGDVISNGKLVMKDPILLILKSAANINIDINVPKIKAVVDGVGSMNLKGVTEDLDLQLNNGNAKCFDLKADNVTVNNYGIGEADVYASKTLNANADDIGGIVYRGSPEVKSKNIGSLSTIRRAE